MIKNLGGYAPPNPYKGFHPLTLLPPRMYAAEIKFGASPFQ